MSRRFDVAVMHDFFVDRLVHMKDLGRMQRTVIEKAESGGGGIHGIAQSEIRGGNAVNLANAAARLGLKTFLVTHSDEDHEGMLKRSFAGLPAVLSVKKSPPGLTVALEEKVNVMLGDGGGAENFGPGLLNTEDWDALASSEVVCSVNWAANKRGTELLEAVRERLGPGKTIFFDPADFRDRRREFSLLLVKMKKYQLVDWISMNEEEARSAAGLLGIKGKGMKDVCGSMATQMRARVDVHTALGSFTSEGGEALSSPSPKTKPKRLTGAGDVWDAASIYARLNDFEDRERLRFANASARLYLERDEPTPPTLEEVRASLG